MVNKRRPAKRIKPVKKEKEYLINENIKYDKLEVPICKIVNFGKFQYEQKKKRDEIKSRAPQNVVKEIRMQSNIGDNDFAFKVRHCIDFLQKGFSVKVIMMFFGRTINFKENGITILNKFVEQVTEFGNPESNFKEDGKKIFVNILPKKN